jgi:hypothetical protein
VVQRPRPARGAAVYTDSQAMARRFESLLATNPRSSGAERSRIAPLAPGPRRSPAEVREPRSDSPSSADQDRGKGRSWPAAIVIGDGARPVYRR